MKNRPTFLGLLLCLLVLNHTNCLSQTADLKKSEKRLANLYSKLLALQSSDSAVYYSNLFGKEFKQLIKNNPLTLGYSFKTLLDSGYCRIQTSQDSNLRVYSWDTTLGGTMHFFHEVYQFKAQSKVLTKIPIYPEGDAGSYCSKIHMVTIQNQTYYLVISNGIYSSKDISQSIQIFTIKNNALVDTVKLFKTKTKLLNRIDVAYDFFSVVDRLERPVEVISFDEGKKIIYVAVVNEKNQVTKKNILYQLKGNYFEYIGIETGKRK